MGGADAVLAKAKAAFAGETTLGGPGGQSRRPGEPKNQAGRDLQADALEQLGYQAENGTWRNFYLTGAMELRNGVHKGPARTPAARTSCGRCRWTCSSITWPCR